MVESVVQSSVEMVVPVEKAKLRVLYVDDESSLLRVAKQCLEELGQFQVDIAESVKEALGKLEKGRYDAIVSDYQMPAEDGLQFLKELREEGDCTPFIMFTGRGREEVAVEALNLGADQYLNKTGDVEAVYCELGHAIRTTVERRRVWEERTRAEMALKACGERYGRLFESTVEGVLINGSDGNISSLNPAAANILGYSSPKELIGKPAVELYADPESRVLLLQELMKEGHVQERELTWKRKDGILIEVSASATAQKDEKGNLLRTEEIFRDVTERKRSEAELSRLASFPERNPNPVLEIDMSGKINYLNPAARELLSQLHDSRLLDDFEEELKAAIGEYATHQNHSFVRENVKIGDRYYQQSIHYVPESAALRIYMIGSSERRKAEEALRKSEGKLRESESARAQYFRALFMGNPEAAAYVGSDYCVLNINPRFEELFGYSLAEIKGKRINDVLVQEGMREEAECLNREAAEGYVYVNTERRRKDGSLVPVSVSAAPISVEGRLVGYVAMYKDISELKNAERKLESMNEKLRVVGGLTRHDVRNKLSVMTGNLYWNKKKLMDRPDILASFKDMESACGQIVRIFDFARDYEMLGVEELAYVDVEDAVQKAVSLFSDLKGVKITDGCHGLSVLADSLLRILFYNLIDNSLKYGQKTSAIIVHYKQTSQDALKIVYEDDGVGIPAAEKLKLFKEGYSTGGSTGYGLYLISKMMDVYGWSIQETGEAGRGAQFTMIIPKMNRAGKESYKLH